MYPVFRRLALLGVVVCLLGGFLPAPAEAGTHHHAVSKTHRHKSHKKSRGNARLRTAQTHLANLGYYKGKIDGIMGPKTRLALKSFQCHQGGLLVTGTLTTATYNALVEADKTRAMSSLPLNQGEPTPLTPAPAPAPDFYATHPDFYGYYNQQYENAGLLGFPQNITSRFGKLELSENMNGAIKRYDLMLNGQPLLVVDGQPSIIGISRTYSLGPEDVIILTSYEDKNPVCLYAHHLLVLHEGGSNVLDVQNCTRGYQAKVANDSLFITFPESDDNRDVGATWHYEKGDLERL